MSSHYKKKRNKLSQVVAVMTGHGPFNKHLQNLGITDGPLEETAAHILMECPGVAAYRSEHLGQPEALRDVFSSLKGLLGFLDELGWQ